MGDHLKGDRFMQVETTFGTFFVEKTGEGERTLVLLHGLGSSGITFSEIGPLLQDQDLLIPDLLGFGRSDRPWRFSYSLLDQAHSVLQLLDRLNRSAISIIGHSMGGNVAMAMALLAPDRVDNLIVAEPNLVPTRGKNRRSISARADGISESFYVDRFQEIFADFKPTSGTKIFSRLYWNTLQQASPVAMYRASEALLDLNEWDVWSLYKTRVTGSLVGERSLEGIHVQKSLTGSAPLCLIADAGHDMFLENPTSCVAAVRALLA